jgi:penicillin-insensitive murein DD-endopeptidase
MSCRYLLTQSTNLKLCLGALAGLGLALCLSSKVSLAEEGPVPDHREAKKAFSAVTAPAGQAAPEAIGHYDRGCVAGAEKLPSNGPAWQVMRLSRNRSWGHPALLSYIEKLAGEAKGSDGWPGLLVGDMAQPIGGPLLGGHASHQIGLDADLWYLPMPGHVLSAAEREELAAVNLVDAASLTVAKPAWTGAHAKLLHRAASFPEIARIFVHPAIKKALCETAGEDRAWLQKIRPWNGHDDHFHIRLNCPPGSPACVSQLPLPPDDGCGKELDDWFKRLRAKKPARPPKAPKPVLVSDLPQQCQALLTATEQAEKARAASPNARKS